MSEVTTRFGLVEVCIDRAAEYTVSYLSVESQLADGSGSGEVPDLLDVTPGEAMKFIDTLVADLAKARSVLEDLASGGTVDA